MARDESRDIALSRLLDIGGSQSLDGGPFTVWNWSALSDGASPGWYRYVPHEQLQAAQKRIAELEQELTLDRRADNWHSKLPRLPIVEDRTLAQRIADGDSEVPRCKDGCGHWNPVRFGDSGACTDERFMPIDGSGFCSNHTRLTNGK